MSAPEADSITKGAEQTTASPWLAGLDEEKLSAFEKLKQKILDDPSLTATQKRWCTDACLCRYLRARQWSLEKVPSLESCAYALLDANFERKAEAMLRNTLKWRAENNLDTLRCETVESQIVRGHMYSYGVDRQGRPVCVLRVHTEEDPHTPEQKLLFMIYSMERAIRLMDESKGVEKMTWIVSCAGYNLKYNGDVGFARSLLACLQDHYPERLGLLLICDAPFIFRAMWKLVYPFVDEKTKKKIFFVSGSNEEKARAISEHIDLDQVEKAFCGNSDYVFDPAAYMKMLKEEEKTLYDDCN